MRNQMEEICTNCDFANSATYNTKKPSMANKVLNNTISDSIESGVLKQDTVTATGTTEDNESSDQSGYHGLVIRKATGNPLLGCVTLMLIVIYDILRVINRQPGVETQKQSHYTKSNHRSAYRENYLLCDGM